eukprot:524841_1
MVNVFICLLYFTFSFLYVCSINKPEHVLLIGIDGFGGKYLVNSTHFLPTINEIIFDGCYTFHARNVQPMESAPNWGTILTGLRPIESGIFSNHWSYIQNIKPLNISSLGMIPVSYNYTSNYSLPQLPTIFDILKAYNSSITTAVSYNWDWFHNLFQNNSNIDHIYYQNNTFNDTLNVYKLIEFINDHKPNLMFSYFGSLDEYGHSSYWGSQKYYNISIYIDTLINKLINALANNNILNKTQIIIIADHGGYGHNHGHFDAANIFIPIIFYGYCINKNVDITHLFMENIDITPFILNSFGFDINQFKYMKGRVCNEIYQTHCLIDSDDISHQLQHIENHNVLLIVIIVILSLCVIALFVVIMCCYFRKK